MNKEIILKSNEYLNNIYRSIDTKHPFKHDLREFDFAYLAGYQAAMMSMFDGYLDLLVDLENESENDL